MIVSHMAPSSINMSSYRAIWTHFRSNSPIFEETQVPKSIYLNFQISGKFVLIRRENIFPKVVRLAKMMQNRIDEIFWGQTFKNTPYFNVRAADFWKPLTSDYVAQGCFSLRKRGRHIFGSP